MAKEIILPYSEAIKRAKSAVIEIYDAIEYKYITIEGYITPYIRIDNEKIPFSASGKYFYYLRHNRDNDTVIDSITENEAYINFYGMFITDAELPFYPSCDLDELEIISYKINN